MKFKNSTLYRLLTGVLTCAFALTPLNAYALEDPESQAAYGKTIESNAWENWPAGPAIYAESAVVMEADTGTILYSKDMNAKRYPASITKIMTALVTLENCELDEEVYFSYYATHSIEYGSSSIARTEDEILTVEETLYGLMLESANECANALAEHIAGSVDEFAVLMNEKAAQLGCTNTHFVNPHGLHDENHYTSAHDMALITRAAAANDDFRRICGQRSYELRATNKNENVLTMYNHHYMICNNKTSKYLDDTVFAGKTGYTTDALNTLMTCGTRNGMDVVVITMRTKSSGQRGVPLYTDTQALLDYANNFQKLNISENEQTFLIDNAYDFSIDSAAADDSGSLISIDQTGCIILPNAASFKDAVPSIAFLGDDNDKKPYLTYEYAGQIVGQASITLEETQTEEFAFTDTESDENKDASSEKDTKFITVNLKIVFLILGILILIFILILLIYRFYRKNRAKIYKAINIYQKRKLLKRRRYRRRRR